MENLKCAACGSANLMKNGNKNGRQNYRCSDCGSHRSPVGTSDATPVATPKPQKVGLSIGEFRKRHDVQYILSKVFETLKPETFYEKSDIIRLSGLRPGYPGLSTVLESADFKKYSGRAGGQTYFARDELIEQMKNDGILS